MFVLKQLSSPEEFKEQPPKSDSLQFLYATTIPGSILISASLPQSVKETEWLVSSAKVIALRSLSSPVFFKRIVHIYPISTMTPITSKVACVYNSGKLLISLKLHASLPIAESSGTSLNSVL